VSDSHDNSIIYIIRFYSGKPLHEQNKDK